LIVKIGISFPRNISKTRPSGGEELRNANKDEVLNAAVHRTDNLDAPYSVVILIRNLQPDNIKSTPEVELGFSTSALRKYWRVKYVALI
jgi:adenosine/AMP kinase